MDSWRSRYILGAIAHNMDAVCEMRQWRDLVRKEVRHNYTFHTTALPAWQKKHPQRTSSHGMDRITRDHLELAASLGAACRSASKLGPGDRRLNCRFSDVAVSTQAECALHEVAALLCLAVCSCICCVGLLCCV